MKLRDIIENLKIFNSGWNKRPDVPLYFNEKLFTKQQIENYEKTIAYLEEKNNERHAHQWNGKTNFERNTPTN